jgi:anti-anti-sigma factor
MSKTLLDKGDLSVDSQVIEAVRLTSLNSRCKAKSHEEELIVDLDIRESGAICVLKLKGRLVSGEAVSQFEEAFQRALAEGHIFLVLDIEALPYIDSSGIGSIVNALRQANKIGGTVKLVNPAPFVSKTLKMVGLLPLFTVYESEEEALSACGG